MQLTQANYSNMELCVLRMCMQKYNNILMYTLLIHKAQ